MKKGSFYAALFWVLTLGQTSHVWSARPLRQLTADEKQQIYRSALAVLPESRRPPGLQIEGLPAQAAGCATPIVTAVRRYFGQFSPEQQAFLRKLVIRPQLPSSFVSAGGRFRIHYTSSGEDAVSARDANGNGVPDFVESVAEGFENSFNVEVDELAYRQPPDDGGVDGPEYDVYIEDLGRQFYGFTQGEEGVTTTSNDDLTSYIEIDNDFNNGHFTTGINGALVTAAHEFYHAIQFGYRTLATDEERFYYELCSVWMEDVVYDDINDYLQYMPSFFSRRDVPFNLFTNSNFGEALWDHFLVKKFQSPDLIRRTWEIMQDNILAIDAIDMMLQENSTSLAFEFADFGIWNYFTGSRADVVNYYEEGNLYPEIAIRDTFTVVNKVTVVDSSKSLTHRYFSFRIPAPDDYSITGVTENPANWLFSALILENGMPPRSLIFQPATGENLGFLPANSDVVVIAVNANVVDGSELFKLNSSYFNFSLTLQRGSVTTPTEEGIVDIYPNPFVQSQANQVTFVFDLTGAAGNAVVRILRSDGRLVREQQLNNRLSVFSWDGTDGSREAVSSGIYIVQLDDGNKIFQKKFAFIRR